MTELKLYFFGHMMQRVLEKSKVLRKVEGKVRRGLQGRGTQFQGLWVYLGRPEGPGWR